jgi:hypothetical protein
VELVLELVLEVLVLELDVEEVDVVVAIASKGQ